MSTRDGGDGGLLLVQFIGFVFMLLFYVAEPLWNFTHILANLICLVNACHYLLQEVGILSIHIVSGILFYSILESDR